MCVDFTSIFIAAHQEPPQWKDPFYWIAFVLMGIPSEAVRPHQCQLETIWKRAPAYKRLCDRFA